MTLIVCVDERLGMAFNRRRQSRDRAVCEDIVALAAGRIIRMSEHSARLFEGLGGTIDAGDGYMDRAGPGELCFVELDPADGPAARAKRIVLYRWDRHYPADLYFTVPLDNWRQLEVAQFSGTSHELITREVYERG